MAEATAIDTVEVSIENEYERAFVSAELWSMLREHAEETVQDQPSLSELLLSQDGADHYWRTREKAADLEALIREAGEPQTRTVTLPMSRAAFVDSVREEVEFLWNFRENLVAKGATDEDRRTYIAAAAAGAAMIARYADPQDFDQHTTGEVTA